MPIFALLGALVFVAFILIVPVWIVDLIELSAARSAAGPAKFKRRDIVWSDKTNENIQITKRKKRCITTEDDFYFEWFYDGIALGTGRHGRIEGLGKREFISELYLNPMPEPSSSPDLEAT